MHASKVTGELTIAEQYCRALGLTGAEKPRSSDGTGSKASSCATRHALVQPPEVDPPCAPERP